MTRQRTAQLAVVALCLTLLATGAGAAGPTGDAGFTPVYHPTLAVAPARGAIVIDGEVDDAGWAGAARAGNFAEHQPGDQVRPPVDTEVLVTYDRENFYLAFLCQDDPATVRSAFCERDQVWGTDNVILALDTYGTQAWAYEIVVNPHGIQGDLLWSPAGGEDAGYDLIYRSAGRLTAAGWQVEMAIPFASLRFPDTERQVWRADFWRNRPREVRGQYSWAAYDRDEPCWPCQWGTLTGIENVKPGRGLELLPAVTAHQSGARGADGDFHEGKVLGDLSLTAKYAPTSALTAEATYNPDFSQVESDAGQIDVNTTFALQYPEKRPFFQEGAEMFGTRFNVLYTRAINDPRYAVKFTGRPGRTNVALLCAWDENTPLIVPFAEQSGFAAPGGSLASVLRLRHSLGAQDHVGLIASDRRLDSDGRNSVLGADARVRLGRNLSLQGQAIVSRTTEADGLALDVERPDSLFDRGRHTVALDGEEFTGHAWNLALAREGRRWGLTANFWERSPTFRVDNGFEPRNDQRLGTLSSNWVERFEGGLVQWVQASGMLARQWDFAGINKDEWAMGTLATRLRVAQTQAALTHMISGELFGGRRFDGIDSWELELSGVPCDGLSYELEASTGRRIARRAGVLGRQQTLSVEASFKPLDRLTFDLQYDYARSGDLDTGETLFDGYIARGRASLQLTRELSTRLVAQYDRFARRWQLDPLVTYRLNPFSIFYVGSTNGFDEVRAPEGGPSTWPLADRTYFLKLQYLLRS